MALVTTLTYMCMSGVGVDSKCMCVFVCVCVCVCVRVSHPCISREGRGSDGDQGQGENTSCCEKLLGLGGFLEPVTKNSVTFGGMCVEVTHEHNTLKLNHTSTIKSHSKTYCIRCMCICTQIHMLIILGDVCCDFFST